MLELRVVAVRSVARTLHMLAPILHRVRLPSAGSESREPSNGGGTMQPESTSRLQMRSTAEAQSPSSSGRAEGDLRAAVFAVVRCAFQSPHYGGSANEVDDRTLDAVRSICAMARANEVRAETLILAIKGGWRQIPEARGMTRIDAEVKLAGLITMCIREYYAPRGRL